MSLIQSFVSSVQNIARIPELRTKLLVTLGLLIVYRLGFYVPIPGVDTAAVMQIVQQQSQTPMGAIMNLVDLVSGGSFLSCTLFALGVMPYISASIIFQLLVKVIPSWEQMQKEGEAGRRRINQWTRYATIGIAALQSFFMMSSLRIQYPQLVTGGAEFLVIAILALTTGTMFLMWLGEKITDHGIGNGASIIIMAGIVANIPQSLRDLLGRFWQGSVAFPAVVAVIISFLLTVSGVIFITQGQRRIPIQQAKYTRGGRVYGGQRHYIPLRVNMAGVMPIIFASALLAFPNIIISLIPGGQGSALGQLFVERGSFAYVLLYVGLTFFFSYFWNQLIFNPMDMANNMKEWGSFVPGIRPGKKTAEFLEQIMNRITLAGATFLAFIAVMPLMLFRWTGIGFVFLLGGTSILIVVGVALDLVQKIESHLLMRHYKGFLGGGGIRGRR